MATVLINKQIYKQIHVIHVRNPVLRNDGPVKRIAGISNLGGATIAFTNINGNLFYVSSKVSSVDNFNKELGYAVTSGRLLKWLNAGTPQSSEDVAFNMYGVKSVNIKAKANPDNLTRIDSESVVKAYLENTNKAYMIYNRRIVQAKYSIIDSTNFFNSDNDD